MRWATQSQLKKAWPMQLLQNPSIPSSYGPHTAVLKLQQSAGSSGPLVLLLIDTLPAPLHPQWPHRRVKGTSFHRARPLFHLARVAPGELPTVGFIIPSHQTSCELWTLAEIRPHRPPRAKELPQASCPSPVLTGLDPVSPLNCPSLVAPHTTLGASSMLQQPNIEH